jgi:hypothetical protein
VPAPRKPPPSASALLDDAGSDLVVEESAILHVPPEARMESAPGAGTTLSAPAAPPFLPGVPIEEPLFPAAIDAVEPAAETSYVRRVQQKRGNAWAGLVVPAVCVAIVGGIGAAYWWLTRETMTGELTGEVFQADQALVGYVAREEIEVPSDVLDEFLRKLRDVPETVESDLLYVEFVAEPSGIRIMLRPGRDSELVRVNPRSRPAVARFVTEHAGELDAVVQAERTASARQLVLDWQSAAGSGMRLGNLLTYRDSVGLNALRKGLAYHSTAIVGSTAYPCVHEDDKGWLYFALPARVKEFTLTRRELKGRESPLPDEYRITVRVSAPETAAGPEASSEQASPTKDVLPDMESGTSPDNDVGTMGNADPRRFGRI